jgi:hypothetical protein
MQLLGGDEAVRSTPLSIGGGIVLEPFLEIRKGHRISAEEPPSFSAAVTLF